MNTTYNEQVTVILSNIILFSIIAVVYSIYNYIKLFEKYCFLLQEFLITQIFFYNLVLVCSICAL